MKFVFWGMIGGVAYILLLISLFLGVRYKTSCDYNTELLGKILRGECIAVQQGQCITQKQYNYYLKNNILDIPDILIKDLKKNEDKRLQKYLK